jgi:hypothetical protein
MFALIAFVALAAVVLARLAVVVRTDRSLTPPRSHSHELGAQRTRHLRIV